MFKLASVILGLSLSSLAFADTVVPLNMTADNGVGTAVGTVTLTKTQYGVLLTPNLHGLTPGAHGFHIHENPSCDQNGMAAGGHFDPAHTGKHLGPYNNKGHFGDLPVLFVNADGTATTPILAPRIHDLSKINAHALMVHDMGDNYSDTPEKLGGGGGRMACGVIKVS